MSFKLKRFIISAIIAICIFAMVISGCTNESMVEVEPIEPVETEPVEEVIMDVVEPTEPVVVEEVVEETEPKEVMKEPEKTPEKVDSSNEVTEKPKKEEAKKESSDSNLVSLGRFKLTSYCSCSRCCGKSDGITATGTKAKQGRTIAVDPSVIPYGTKVIINGHTYVAEDCGGAIDGNRIDIFFNSHKDALKFGVQYATVYKVVS